MAIAPASTPGAGTGTNGVLITLPLNGNAVTVQMGNNNRAAGAPGSTVGKANSMPASKNRRGTRGRGVNSSGGASGPAFTALDQQIVRLDSSFDGLVDKDPWVIYAANIFEDWQLCANCQPDWGSKKLYRQYNFNRGLVGLASVESPIDNTATCETEAINAIYVINGASRDVEFQSVIVQSPYSFVIAKIGLALGNPLVQFNESDNFAQQPDGSPIADWMLQVAAALGIPQDGNEYVRAFKLCVFDMNGAPGTLQDCVFQFQIKP